MLPANPAKTAAKPRRDRTLTPTRAVNRAMRLMYAAMANEPRELTRGQMQACRIILSTLGKSFDKTNVANSRGMRVELPTWATIPPKPEPQVVLELSQIGESNYFEPKPKHQVLLEVSKPKNGGTRCDHDIPLGFRCDRCAGAALHPDEPDKPPVPS